MGAWLVLVAGVVGLSGVVLGGTIASGEWLATAERPDGSTAFDRSVTSWMVDHRASGATLVARVFSAVGSQKAFVPVVAIMALVLIRQRGWRSFGLLGVAWGGAILLYSLAKHAVGRPRPPADLWLTRASGKALPSGHAMQSLSTLVALAVIAATLVRPSHRLLWTAAAICADITLTTGAHLHCHGKGRKERVTPLTAQTAAVLRVWQHERAGHRDDPVFPTSRGHRLSRDAIAWLLAKHVATAAAGCPSMRAKTITPHTLRDTCAMRLLHAGNDVTVIALWLGHESTQTTHIYLHANLALKEKALARTAPTNTPPGRYRPPDQLLAFLEAL